MLSFGNSNKLTYDYDEARHDAWFKKNQLLPAGLPPAVAVTETQILREHHGPSLTVQLLAEPAYVTPIVISPPSHVRLMLDLSGARRVGLYSNGKSLEYDTVPGTVKLSTPYDLPHELKWVPLSADPVRLAHVYLAPELLAQTAEAAGLDAARIELRAGIGVADPVLYELGRALADELAAPQGLDSLYAETTAQMLAVHLLRRHCACPHELPDYRGKLAAPRLRAVREYVQAHLSEAIRLEELAGLAFMSPYHFCRVFKRTTGLTPNQFVIRQRLTRAAELLQHSRLSIKEVAAAVGYASPGHFTQLLRRHLGRLPLDLVKQRSA